MGNFLLQILDHFDLAFDAEKHTLPAYAIAAEKPVQKTQKKPAEKTRKNRLEKHPHFVEQLERDKDGNIIISHVNERGADNSLTEADLYALRAASLDVSVAAVVKREKIKPVGEVALSNAQIASKYHTPGKRDGYSKRNIAKIAKIVAPSVGGGA